MRVHRRVAASLLLLWAWETSAHPEPGGDDVDAGAVESRRRTDSRGVVSGVGGADVPAASGAAESSRSSELGVESRDGGVTQPRGSSGSSGADEPSSPPRGPGLDSRDDRASTSRAPGVASLDADASEVRPSAAVGAAPLANGTAGADATDGWPSPDSEVTSTAASSSAPLGTTTVRATRAGHAASEVTVTQDVVQAAPKSGATDLLRLVPGLVASQHSGEGKAQQLFLRGFDAVHGQDVELQVAGLPVNEVSHVHALGYADLNWLIPETVQRIRVTEGSYRASQGDFAVAVTVQYELGLPEPGVTASASYGSFNRARLFVGARPADSADTFAAAEVVQGDGFGPQRAFGRASLLAQAVLKLGQARLRAVVGSAAARFDSPGVVRQDTVDAGTAGFFDAFGLRQGGSTSRHQLLLGVDLPSDAGRTALEVFGVLSDLRLRNNFTGFLLHPEGDGLEQQQSDGVVGARATHRTHFHPLGSLVSLELGLGGRRDGIHQSQRGYREADGSPYRDDFAATITQTALNAWTEVAWQPARWRFMLGGRVDVLHYDVLDELAFAGQGATRAAFGAHWGLKAGVERQLGEAWRLFLNYGDGFRSPQARSLADGERAPFVSVRGAELGASFATKRVDVRGALFGSYVANDFFFDHTVGTTVYVGSTLRGGAQAMVTARPTADVLVSASLTGATAHVLDTHSLLPYFAPLVGRVDASWTRTFAWRGLDWTPRVGAGLTLIGPRPLPYDEFSHAIFLADVRAGLRVGRVEARLDVQNLLDARWRDGEFVYPSSWSAGSAASLLPARHLTAGSPRTFLLSLEVHL